MVPRLSLSAEQFRLQTSGRVFSVIDLSLSGMALLIADSKDRVHFHVGASIEGHLNIRREKYTVAARIAYVQGDRVGCQFENLMRKGLDAIQSLLEPETLGADLKPVPALDSSLLWYHGPLGTDLLIQRSADGSYGGFSVYVLGNYVQWAQDEGVTTGLVSAASEPHVSWGIHRLQTLELQPDEQADEKKLGIAKTLILSSKLPNALKNRCVRTLEKRA